ncbi:SpoIIE family protein phosphatase [Streptomyces massasporeus]|uniref:SpoIIE family protein phosphatase n=1 Tax=Streptomyces massasporeus TaxID=67324 RepID=UPI003455B6B9
MDGRPPRRTRPAIHHRHRHRRVGPGAVGARAGVSVLGTPLPGRGAGAFHTAPGDIVLLCTDGLLEARDSTGSFYPLVDRLRYWPGGDPGSLVSYLCADLLRHTGGSALNDDAALVALRPAPLPSSPDVPDRWGPHDRRAVPGGDRADALA